MERKQPKKNKLDAFKLRVAKIKADRQKFYDGLAEIEQLKKEYYEIMAENEEQIKKFQAEIDFTRHEISTLSVRGDKHPGKPVFYAEKKLQFFNIDKIKNIELPHKCKYEDFRILLERKINVDHLMTNVLYFKLFLLMSIDESHNVVESCFEILRRNIMSWVPAFRHIIKVILNWGTTCEALCISKYEENAVFPKGTRLKEGVCNYSVELSSTNFSSVLDYLGEVFKHNDIYTKSEKVILIKCLLTMSLDNGPLLTHVQMNISSCISRCFHSFSQWDDFTIVNICRLIYNESDHFHNKVAVITRTLPKIGRCNDISSCLSYTVLCAFLNRPPKYLFPFEDEDIMELVTAVEIDPDSKEDIYKFYVMIQLLNFLVFQRQIYKNKTVLNRIRDHMDMIRWEVVRSSRGFDAAFLKGRIMYCSAVWPLSGQELNTVSF